MPLASETGIPSETPLPSLVGSRRTRYHLMVVGPLLLSSPVRRVSPVP